MKKTTVSLLASALAATFVLPAYPGNITSTLVATKTTTQTSNNVAQPPKSYPVSYRIQIREKRGVVERVVISRTEAQPDESRKITYSDEGYDPVTESWVWGEYSETLSTSRSNASTETFRFGKNFFASSTNFSASENDSRQDRTFTPENGNPAVSLSPSNSSDQWSNTSSDSGNARIRVRSKAPKKGKKATGKIEITLTREGVYSNTYNYGPNDTSTYSSTDSSTRKLVASIGKRSRMTYTVQASDVWNNANSSGLASTGSLQSSELGSGNASGSLDMPTKTSSRKIRSYRLASR